MKLTRLLRDHLAMKTEDVKEGRVYKSRYRKTGVVML
jgi:hypothetical protein